MLGTNHHSDFKTTAANPRIDILGDMPPGLAQLNLDPALVVRWDGEIFHSKFTIDDNRLLIIVDGTSVEKIKKINHTWKWIVCVFHSDNLAPNLDGADEVIEWNATAVEWRLRLDRALCVSKPFIPPLSCDPKLLAMIVHDLRTPLNVIGLSLRMVENAIESGRNAELNEDLEFLRMNVTQLERLLVYLSDYCRVLEGSSCGHASPFSPARLANELFGDERSYSFGLTDVELGIEVREDCPSEVTLDERKARQAIIYAIANARAAAGLTDVKPIKVEFGGHGDRWRVVIALEIPPPRDVENITLSSKKFERLSGVARERDGLDLAIVAEICKEFGGSAQLEYQPGISSTIVLDWPVVQDSHSSGY